MENRKIDNKTVVEIIILGIITFVISFLGLKASNMGIEFVGVRIPVLTYFFAFLSIVPVAVLAAKHKEIIGALVSAVIFGLNLLTFPVPMSLLMFLIQCITGVGLGYSLKRRFSLKKTLAAGAASGLAAFMLSQAIILKLYGLNLIQNEFVNRILNFLVLNKENVVNIKKALLLFLGRTPDEIEILYSQILQLLNMLFMHIPSYIIQIAFIVSFISILFAVYILRRMGQNHSNIEPFSELKLPVGFVWVLLIVDVLKWGVDFQSSVIPSWAILFSNMDHLFTFFFTIQGLALIDFWFRKQGLNGILRAVVYTFGSIFLPLIAFLLPILGILESLMNFRRLEAR